MRTVALIQARVGSSRLPGKVLLPLAGKPMFLHVYERILQARLVDAAVVATSDSVSDDPLAQVCELEGLTCFRGPEDDVLTRLTLAAADTGADAVVRVTADCPLVEWGYVDERLQVLEEEDLDLTYCLSSGSVFEGASVWSMRFLRRLDQEVTAADDREHCGLPYALRRISEFRAREVLPDPQLNAYHYRLTVDERVDYGLMTEIYNAVYEGKPIPIRAALAFLDANPGLAKKNTHVKRKPIRLGNLQKRGAESG